MKYRIQHITEYEYSGRVSHCYNIAHLIPRSTFRQQCLKNTVNVSPTTSFFDKRVDYFGNTAYHFEIQRPHQKLIIDSTTIVETQSQARSMNLDFGMTCQQVRDRMNHSEDASDLGAREFVLSSPMIKTSQSLKKFAAPFFSR